MRMLHNWLALLLVLPLAASAETLSNRSFEAVEGERPVGWRTNTWSGRAEFRLSSQAHSGRHSVEVASSQSGDAGWSMVVPVRPYATYRLSGWIKTEDVTPVEGGRGALINLHTRPEHTDAVTGTRAWTRVEIPIETGADDTLQINCILGYFGRAKGRAWFDDLSLELVSSTPLAPAVQINAASTAEPIHPHVYGQFIEHLGRCIYGGIWAEMLEDRKFFRPVGAEASPWQPIGGATVRMETKDPFVGEHTARIMLPGSRPAGIAHGGLTVVAGKGYVGRIWLAGDASGAPVMVRLVWGDGSDAAETVTVRRLSSRFVKTPLRFTARGAADRARLEIVSAGTGSFRVGTLSLMPADNVRGMRPDTLRVLKELNSPLYRWPGGNFVSGYDWRDGLGDPDRRPPRKNPAWRGVEHNDFGIHEFLDFCREIKTEPLIVVNTGFGDDHSAAAEVEYVNGPPSSHNGAWRARNGRREPWKVKWWGVGNEMWGNWQLGYMALNQYVLKHNLVEKAMRRVDPSILTVASGNMGRWTEGMLTNCADHMTLLSEHFYCQERPGVLAHVMQIPDNIRRRAEAHRRYRQTIRQLQGKDIRISMDEWNYWYGPHVFGELGTRYFLKDGLGIAAGLHEYYRNTDIITMANYAQTVNVIGCIKTTPTAAWMETTGLVLQLYRQRYGTLPLAVTGAPQPLDVAAALTEDRRTLTLGVVNAMGEPMPLDLAFTGIALNGRGRLWRISGSDPQAYNDANSSPVTIREEGVQDLGARIELPPYSVSLYRLDVN
jgi:alpha-N-arabinofuranosidase